MDSTYNPKRKRYDQIVDLPNCITQKFWKEAHVKTRNGDNS